MPSLFDTRKKHALLSEERVAALQPRELLERLGARPGATVADIGCGPGFFTIPAAELVGPEGRVYAADVQGDMLSAVKTRVDERGLANVRIVKTSQSEIPLPPQSCDLALLAFVLHEVSARAGFLRRVARLAKPTGRVAVIEWTRGEPPGKAGGAVEGPPMEDRVTRDELLADARAAGLQLEEERDLNERQYLCTFTPAPSALI